MTDQQSPDDLSRLLPFYLNGSLPPPDRERVEAGLAASSALRDELAEHRRLLDLVKAGAGDWHDAPVPAAPWIAVPEAATSKSPARSILAFLSPANWSPAISLALALAVPALGGALVWQNGKIADLREENYQLAAGKDPASKASILVELKDTANWRDLVKLLSDEGLTIISGGDFGTLSLSSDKRGQELEQQIERLRASPLVASADPAA